MNKIFGIIFLVLAVISLIAAVLGATHQIVVGVLSLIMSVLLLKTKDNED
jgi:hypothetical protein